MTCENDNIARLGSASGQMGRACLDDEERLKIFCDLLEALNKKSNEELVKIIKMVSE